MPRAVRLSRPARLTPYRQRLRGAGGWLPPPRQFKPCVPLDPFTERRRHDPRRFHAFHVSPSWEWGLEIDEEDNLHSVADFLRDAGAETHSAPSFYCEGSQDMYTGGWRSECYHLEGFTDDQIASLVALIDG